MENVAKQLSMMKLRESFTNVWKADIHAGNTCKEEHKINECNSNVFGKNNSNTVEYILMICNIKYHFL
jgi:hypothetical protein